jgi:hypothetical protein
MALLSNKHYETLGVPPTASAGEIREAYRKLAFQYHPDSNPGDKSAEERLKKLQEAYEVLSDPGKRQVYDRGQLYSEGGFTGSGPGTTGDAYPNPAANVSSLDRAGWMQEEAFGQRARDFYVPGFGEKIAATSLSGLKSFFVDAAGGLLAMAVAIPVALHYGGFVYAGPWLIALPVTHFVAGFLLGYTAGNSWSKAARINTGYACYQFFLGLSGNPNWSDIWRVTLWPVGFTFLPAVLGVFLRHLITKRNKARPAKRKQ